MVHTLDIFQPLVLVQDTTLFQMLVLLPSSGTLSAIGGVTFYPLVLGSRSISEIFFWPKRERLRNAQKYMQVKQAFFPFKTNMRDFSSCGGEFESCIFLEYDVVWLGIIGNNVSGGNSSTE